jgi:ribonuclease HI
MEHIVVYCDGASKGNPGPGGWGALVATQTDVVELGGREKHTTNNRMELTAALEALRCAAYLPVQDIVVHTDSSYVINGITKWVRGWESRGWMTKEKKEVLNQDLWQPLVDAEKSCKGRITWQYVGGHIGVAGNERVDTIASDFAEDKQPLLFKGSRSDYAIDITSIAHDAHKHEAKAASRSRSKAKAYSYVSKVNGKIEVHQTWAQCEARVRGKAARYKKATSASEETSIIANFSTS